MLYNVNISLTTVVGSSLILPCDVRPELNLTFAWYFRGSKVSTGVLPSGALSIPSVSVGQEGTYTCLVSNQLGYAQEYVTLTVQGTCVQGRGRAGGGKWGVNRWKWAVHLVMGVARKGTRSTQRVHQHGYT